MKREEKFGKGQSKAETAIEGSKTEGGRENEREWRESGQKRGEERECVG